MKTYIVIEYSVGDWGDLGKETGRIAAYSKADAKNRWQELHNICDYEICFYDFRAVENLEKQIGNEKSNNSRRARL